MALKLLLLIIAATVSGGCKNSRSTKVSSKSAPADRVRPTSKSGAPAPAKATTTSSAPVVADARAEIDSGRSAGGGCPVVCDAPAVTRSSRFKKLGLDTSRVRRQRAHIQFHGRPIEIVETTPLPHAQITALELRFNKKLIQRETLQALGGSDGTFGPFCSPDGRALVLIVEGNERSVIHVFGKKGVHKKLSGSPASFDPASKLLVAGAGMNMEGVSLLDLRTFELKKVKRVVGEVAGMYWREGRLMIVDSGIVDMTKPNRPVRIKGEAPKVWGGFWMREKNKKGMADAATRYLVVGPKSQLLPALHPSS